MNPGNKNNEIFGVFPMVGVHQPLTLCLPLVGVTHQPPLDLQQQNIIDY